MPIPQWAQNLTIDAIIHLQSNGYQVELPVIKWRKSKTEWLNFRTKQIVKGHTNSSGTCYKDYIVITQGTNLTDSKMVLLHELAHWSLHTKTGGHEGHSQKFWMLAWELYRHYKLPIRYVKKREGNYMKGALIAYRKSK